LIESRDKGYIFFTDYYNSGAIWHSIIVKTDINGNVLWHKTIGDGTHAFIAGSLEETPDLGIILCGMTNKYGGVNPDPYMVKFNACGELEWCSVNQTPGIYDFAVRVKQTQSGDYIMLASMSDPNEYYRIQLYKISSEGDWIWKHNYPPHPEVSNDDGADLTLLDDGYLITALCYAPDSGQTEGGAYERLYYIRTDTMGDDVWRLVYGSSNGYHGQAWFNTLKNPSGHFYTVGWHSNYCDTPGLIKVLSDGSESYFADLMPTACPGGCGSLNFLDDTTFVILVGGTINGTRRLKWIKTDTLGAEKYFKEFPINDFMESTGWTIVTHDKKIVGLSDYNLNITLYKLNSSCEFDTVYPGPYVYDSACPYPIVSDTINPDCGMLVGVDEPESHPETTRMQVYPNPAAGRLTVELPKYLVVKNGTGKNLSTTLYRQWQTARLEAYNLEGKRMFERDCSQEEQRVELDVTGWPPGLYYFRLVFNRHTVAGVKVRVE